ncbi:MAG: hypothetical protein LC802_04785 [Acidobacteria bacterium]|nr:hypothetical protein [Acidobacteriota bacterium]
MLSKSNQPWKEITRWEEIEGNNIQDNVIYRLFAIPFLGKDLKLRLKDKEFRTAIRVMLQAKESEMDRERRCYPNSRNVQVYIDNYHPLIYTIYPGFAGAQTLIHELEMPTGSDELYWLTFMRGDSICKHDESTSERYRKYAVEDFGLRIKRPKYTHKGSTALKPPDLQEPDPSLYKCRPRYWELYGGAYLVQVWRSRVFACSVDAIKTIPSNPFSPPYPDVMCFEESWHPKHGRRRSIQGLEKRHTTQSLRPNEFYRDALRILGYTKRRFGPRKYEDADSFLKNLKIVYSDLADREMRRPSMETIALEMKMSRKTLKECLERFEIPWPLQF